MISFHIQVVAIADNGQRHTHEVASLERTEVQAETLGLTLAESKAMLRELQRVVVEHQVAEFVEAHCCCSACGEPRRSKGCHDLPMRTVFGKITIPSPRFVHCDCQPHDAESFSPLAQALPERTRDRLPGGHRGGGRGRLLSSACLNPTRPRCPLLVALVHSPVNRHAAICLQRCHPTIDTFGAAEIR
jgi:hypothetical protein